MHGLRRSHVNHPTLQGHLWQGLQTAGDVVVGCVDHIHAVGRQPVLHGKALGQSDGVSHGITLYLSFDYMVVRQQLVVAIKPAYAHLRGDIRVIGCEHIELDILQGQHVAERETDVGLINLDGVDFSQHHTREVFQVCIVGGVFHQVAEDIVQAVCHHILVFLSALDVEQFQGHVLVASILALIGQVQFKTVHIASDGQDNHVFPSLGSLIEFDRAFGHINGKTLGHSLKDTVANGGRHHRIDGDF